MISITNLKYKLTNIYNDLCEKYQIHNCEFIMGNFKEILRSDYYFNQYYYFTNKQMLECIEYNHFQYYHSFMYSTFIWKNNKLKFRIIFPIENFLNLIYGLANRNMLDDTNDLVDFCIIVLHHEFGHILDITQSYNKMIKNKPVTLELVDKWSTKRENKNIRDFKKFYKESSDLWQKLENEEISDDEYDTFRSIAYFNIEAEAAANKAIELDINELIRLNVKYQASLEEFLYYFE